MLLNDNILYKLSVTNYNGRKTPESSLKLVKVRLVEKFVSLHKLLNDFWIVNIHFFQHTYP